MTAAPQGFGLQGLGLVIYIYTGIMDKKTETTIMGYIGFRV